MQKLKIKNPNNNQIKTTQNRQEIESLIIQQNRTHLSKAMKTSAYNDKLIQSLHINEIRDKILKGELKEQDTDDRNIYEFMKLLKKNQHAPNTTQFKPITLEEWKTVVKRSKKKSVSSVFSNRTYVVCKLLLANEEFTQILITFYNTVIKKGIILERWRNMIDIMIEIFRRIKTYHTSISDHEKITLSKVHYWRKD